MHACLMRALHQQINLITLIIADVCDCEDGRFTYIISLLLYRYSPLLLYRYIITHIYIYIYIYMYIGGAWNHMCLIAYGIRALYGLCH